MPGPPGENGDTGPVGPEGPMVRHFNMHCLWCLRTFMPWHYLCGHGSKIISYLHHYSLVRVHIDFVCIFI